MHDNLYSGASKSACSLRAKSPDPLSVLRSQGFHALFNDRMYFLSQIGGNGYNALWFCP